MLSRRWAGLGPRGNRLRDIVGSDGQRAWVPGIRINQLIEFLCGPTAGGSGVYDCGGEAKPRGDTLSRFNPATVLPLPRESISDCFYSKLRTHHCLFPLIDVLD